jgi:hypothetical protein
MTITSGASTSRRITLGGSIRPSRQRPGPGLFLVSVTVALTRPAGLST